jgi:hypothetical protein
MCLDRRLLSFSSGNWGINNFGKRQSAALKTERLRQKAKSVSVITKNIGVDEEKQLEKKGG